MRVAVVGSPDYTDRDGVIAYLHTLSLNVEVITGNGPGIERLIVSTCGMLCLKANTFPDAATLPVLADRVVMFYEPPGGFQRLKEIREQTISLDKPLELYMVSEAGGSYEVQVQRPERPAQAPETATAATPAVMATAPNVPENPALIRARQMVANLPGWKKDKVTR